MSKKEEEIYIGVKANKDKSVKSIIYLYIFS